MSHFLALQCYNCCMMQVKQEKKSSNVWTCAICNEKQSVRNVFARSEAAKDIRKFVQEFNLLKHSGVTTVAIADDYVERFHKDVKSENTRKSKWSEFLQENPAPSEQSEHSCGNVNFVTSIPEYCSRKRKGKSLFTDGIAPQVDGCVTTSRRKSQNKDTSFELSLHNTMRLGQKTGLKQLAGHGTPTSVRKSTKESDHCESGRRQVLKDWNASQNVRIDQREKNPETENERFSDSSFSASRWTEYLQPERKASTLGVENVTRNWWYDSCRSKVSPGKSSMENLIDTELDELYKLEFSSLHADELVEDEVL